MLLAIVLAQCSCSYMPEPVSFGGAGYYAPGLAASIDAYRGIATGGPIFGNMPGQGVSIVGRRNDMAAQLYVSSEHFIDGGVMFQVNAGNCGNSAPVFAVGNDNVYFGGAATSACSGNPDFLTGALMHNNGYSGSVALYKPGGGYLTIAGSLGGLRAVLPNGEPPNPLDYPAG